MQHMAKASIRGLHIGTSELVRCGADMVIVIERRGQPMPNCVLFRNRDRGATAARSRSTEVWSGSIDAPRFSSFRTDEGQCG
jgi:hypothetical protein